MMPDRRSEVKNANGVNILEGAPLKKTILGGEVLQKHECVLARPRQQEKKVSATMRGSADSLILKKSNAKTMKMRKSDLWLAFCAHQIS